MLKWVLSRLVRWAQSKCDHAGEHVSFDITEQTVMSDELHVKWCHVCGAVAVVSNEESPPPWRTVITYP